MLVTPGITEGGTARYGAIIMLSWLRFVCRLWTREPSPVTYTNLYCLAHKEATEKRASYTEPIVTDARFIFCAGKHKLDPDAFVLLFTKANLAKRQLEETGHSFLIVATFAGNVDIKDKLRILLKSGRKSVLLDHRAEESVGTSIGIEDFIKQL
jgi:hypothetical protein